MRISLRILPAIASILLSLGLFATTTNPAFAASGASSFHLTAERPVTGKKVVGDTLWSCNDAGCSTGSATSRPAIVCAKAARELGKLSSFSFRGEAFDAETLAKCNVKAR